MNRPFSSRICRGFTALTEVHGDEQAADLAGEFGASVRALLPDHGAEAIKSIGDALMLRCERADAAIELGVRIVNEVGRQHGFPVIRVGMHTGSAAERDGDWFGSTVNLAARISGQAGGNQVLLSEATRDAAADLERVSLQERGRRTMRNVSEPVLLFEAVGEGLRSDEGLPIDPVCRMAVDPESAAGTLRHDGVEYRSARWSACTPFRSTRSATPSPATRTPVGDERPTAEDFEREGLVDGLEGSERDARLDLLGQLAEDGAPLSELKRAVEEDRLAMLPIERVFSGDLTVTLSEFCERTGLSAEFVGRDYLALGVSRPDPHEPQFSETDVEAGGMLKQFMDAGVSEEDVFELARIVGRGSAAFTEALLEVLAKTFLRAGDTERDAGLRFAQLADTMMPFLAPFWKTRRDCICGRSSDGR